MCKSGVLNQFQQVYFFNGDLYVQIPENLRHKLINNRGLLKHFIAVDVTADIMLTKDQMMDMMFEHGLGGDLEPQLFVDSVLGSLKYKVFKRIKLKGTLC